MSFLETKEYDLTSRVTIREYSADVGGFSDIHKGDLAEDTRSDSLWGILVGSRWGKAGQGHTRTVAIKCLRGGRNMESGLKRMTAKNLENEANIWHKLDHFNLLPLLGYIKGVSGTVFPSLVSPWCEIGTLDKYIIHQSPRPADRISLMLQIVSAVSYLHSQNILHGDLKPENIFLGHNYQVRLSDFGLAKIPSDGCRFSSSRTHDGGTLRYMSPEFFVDDETGQSPRNLPADIWALAWTFYVILTGLHPYSEMPGASLMQLINCIKCHRIPLDPSNIPCQNSPAGDLSRLRSTVWPILCGCWEINPIHRPKANEVEQGLCEAILLEHSQLFDGPMFNTQVPDTTRPSVIGDEEAFFLELKGEKLRAINPDKARSTLVAAALGYLCYGFRNDAYSTQIQIGWILLNQRQFLAAQAHFNAARCAVDASDLVVACKRGLAQAAIGLGHFDEAIEHYHSALVLCRAGKFFDHEYMVIRDTANAVLNHPRNQDSREDIFRSQNSARKLFKEALWFSMNPEHVNLEYQVQVRCDLVQLESDAGNAAAAQAHALAGFQCALATARYSLVDDVYNYLSETNLLSEAQINAFRVDLLELRSRTAHVPERGVESESSSLVASVS